jgi:multidrug resistance efflux pump
MESVPSPSRRSFARLFFGSLLTLVFVAVGAAFAYRYWHDHAYFVSTDNAQVTGDLVQVGSLNAGRIVATFVEVGDRVQKDQEIAVVSIPQQVMTGTSGNLRLDETTAQATYVSVRAPFAGLVVARLANVGGTVSIGQPIYSMIDVTRVWVRANVEETKVARVVPGQEVDVHIDALAGNFHGRVVAVTPASAGTFSLLPSQNTSSNFVKVTQLVPVKIAVDAPGAVLPLGTSATVRIKVREPEYPALW